MLNKSLGMILYPAQFLSFPGFSRDKFRIPGFSRVFQEENKNPGFSRISRGRTNPDNNKIHMLRSIEVKTETSELDRNYIYD